MQEQDPRRDVLGCNRENQKNVATEPEYLDRNQSKNQRLEHAGHPDKISPTSVSASRGLIAAPDTPLAFL